MLRVRTVFQALSLFILVYCDNSKLVQYKKYLNKAILNESLAVQNSPSASFKAQALAFCTIKCNLNTECELISFDNQNQCKLFSNQTTTFDLTNSSTTNVYSKNRIKFCLNEDLFYPDMSQGKCVPRKANGVGCETSEQCMISLECSGLNCSCISPTKK